MRSSSKFFVIFLLIAAFAGGSIAQQRTEIGDKKAARMLLGKHKLSLQWISWDYFGSANVLNRKGVYSIKGEQRSRKGNDIVKVEGFITKITAKEFWLNGKVTTKVSHNNNGEECVREGESIVFRITGKRKYWRMQDINSPCEEIADYVDIYFR